MTAYHENAGNPPTGPLSRLKLGQARRPSLKATDTTEQKGSKRTATAPSIYAKAAEARLVRSRKDNEAPVLPLRRENKTFGAKV